MRSHIKLGRIFGIEIGIHYSWFIIALLITFSLAQQFRHANHDWSTLVVWSTAGLTAVLFFVCLLAHELSHSLVAKAHKLPVRRITLFALGGVSVIEKEATDAKTEFLVAIVGPITSLVIGGVMIGIARALGANPSAPQSATLSIVYWLGYINIYLGVFNMLPGFPLDGGRVLRSIAWWVTHSMERATRIATRIGQGVALIFIVVGIYAAFAERAGFSGLWIAFIGWFLLQAASANYMEVELKHALEGLKAKDLMSRDCVQVEGWISLQDLVDEYILRTGRRCFVVNVAGRMAGLVTPHEIRTVERNLWPMTPVQQVMRPLDRVRTVAPEAPVSEALELMAKEDLNQLPVVADRNLEGILSRGDIMQVLRSRIELKR